MSTTTTTSLTPTSQVGKTILGTIRELTAYAGLTPSYDTAATLNAKYSNNASLVPTALPAVRYFGIGIGGSFNVDTGSLSQAYPVLGTNMDLYTPIPFRCVPVEQDLSSVDRAPYRMRVRQTINGADYYLYYLKLITYSQTTVQLTKTDPVTQLQVPYVLDYTNLRPTKPTVNSSGAVTSSVTEVNASVTSTLALTGAEVAEVINVLYAGDLRYAKISEIGLYFGEDRVVAGTNSAGAAISYTESVLATLSMAYNWLGDDYSNPSRTSGFQIVQGNGDLLLL
jgi:hypothetical protein